jgi:1-acyl-sn-glycerol-3-phosphate acyltransferase
MAVKRGPADAALEPPIHLPGALYAALRALAHLINRSYWRVSVEGANIPETGPVILAPVHRSFIDFFIVSDVVPRSRKLFFMAKDDLWRSRILGKVLESTGAFPVHREGTDRLALRLAEELLRHGEVLVMFPEGTRRAGPLVEDLQEGAAFLAARTGAAIVPIGIAGTTESLPKGSKLPRPVKVHVVVGDALVVPRREGVRIPRREVRELSSRLCSELQHVYDVALSRTQR